MAPNLTIGSPDTNSNESDGYDATEIEEEEESSSGEHGYGVCGLTTIRDEVGTIFSYDFDGTEDAVYVAIGKPSRADTAMDALIWTVNHAVVNRSSTVVFLVHVFPETKLIPSPLGKLPVSQVNPQHKEMYMSQQRAKRREYLQKFLGACSNSEVKVDTMLLESDDEAKAILNLIPILHMKKLVLGVNKSTGKKMRSRKSKGVADQILQNAPEFCDVKVICEGKEMSELAWDLFSPSPSASPSPSVSSRGSDYSVKFGQEEGGIAAAATATCGCFKL